MAAGAERHCRGSPGAEPLRHPAVPGRRRQQRLRSVAGSRRRPIPARRSGDAEVAEPLESRGGRQAPPRVPLGAHARGTAASRTSPGGRRRHHVAPRGAPGVALPAASKWLLPYRQQQRAGRQLPRFLSRFPRRSAAWLKSTTRCRSLTENRLLDAS